MERENTQTFFLSKVLNVEEKKNNVYFWGDKVLTMETLYKWKEEREKQAGNWGVRKDTAVRPLGLHSVA